MADRDFIFRFDGQEYRVGNLTLEEAGELETRLGIRWGQLSPIGSVVHRRACMAVFLRRTKSEQETAKLLNDIGLYESEAMWEMVELDTPDEYQDGVPLAAGGTSTPG